MSAVLLAVLVAAAIAVVLGLDALFVPAARPTARIPGQRRGRHTHRAVAGHRIHIQLRSHR
ncbi:hypothetical protein ACU61A_15910 [Pseudonocardia sichuanensis]